MSFSRVCVSGKRADPDRVYYNANVVNSGNQVLQTTQYPQITFGDNRQNPILYDTADYKVAVEDFTINGGSKTLPLFIPQISPQVVQTAITAFSAVPVANTTPPTTGFTSCLVTYTTASSTGLIVGLNIDSVFISGYPKYSTTDNKEIVAVTPTSFTIILECIPIANTVVTFSFTLYKNPFDINTTSYSVTLGVTTPSGSTSFEQRIIWVPENESEFVPTPSIALPRQSESEYYYLYSYSHWVKLVNTALLGAYAGLIANAGSFGTKCPFIQYDPNTALFSIYQDANTCLVPYGSPLQAPFDSAISATPGYGAGEYSFLGMNANLQALLSNFPALYYGPNGLFRNTPGQFLPEYIIDMGLTNLNVSSPAVGTQALGLGLKQITSSPLVNPFTNTAIADSSFVQLTQDYNSTGSMWSPIASIVIGTTQVPVRNEYVSNPLLIGENNIGIENPSGGAFQKVLVEVPINAVTAEIWRGWILYQPLVPTFSSLDPNHSGLVDIDFQVFWRSRLTNSLIPMRMLNTGSMNIRLLFEKK